MNNLNYLNDIIYSNCLGYLNHLHYPNFLYLNHLYFQIPLYIIYLYIIHFSTEVNAKPNTSKALIFNDNI